MEAGLSDVGRGNISSAGTGRSLVCREPDSVMMGPSVDERL